MKNNFQFLIIVVCLTSFGCEKDIPKHLEGFSIVVDNKVVLNRRDIDYYDFSTHLVYLKRGYPQLSCEMTQAFSVYADGVEIYSGPLVSLYSSHLPSGPSILCSSLIDNYVLEIFNYHSTFSSNPDPREDDRIVRALKKYNQFHEGLSCTIKSINRLGPRQIEIEVELKNNDSFNYYCLDPDKMGNELFHYFNNGLLLFNVESQEMFYHNTAIVQPQQWNSWDQEWISLLKSKEFMTFSIIYDNYDEVPAGEYRAIFQYRGLTHQVSKKDLQQDDGRIWLGTIMATKDVVF